jgi:type VI secretion system lysozyme-like protein
VSTRTLLERISDEGTGVGQRSRADEARGAAVDSVLRHLRRMLNTVHDDSLTVPDYGIVDLTGLLRDVPDSIEHVRASILASINRYEKRLTDVRVTHVPDPEHGDVLRFRITARLVGDRGPSRVQVETTVEPTGHVRVQG